MAEEIWIIGTEPPCPRCDYLTQMVRDVANELGLSVPVHHLSYTDPKARQVAAQSGLEPGTAKDVASKANIAMDWDAVYVLLDTPLPTQPSETCCPTIAAKWSPELDEALRPCEREALKAGIMMTPVLVINGKRVHQGSVPSREQVLNWIVQGFPGCTGRRKTQITVEVLGPGCEKCDTLYRHALEATAGLDADFCSVMKRTDIGYFLSLGVTVTPGLVINGEVISKGKVLSPTQIGEHLKRYGAGQD